MDGAGELEAAGAGLEPEDPVLPGVEGTLPPCAPLSTSCEGNSGAEGEDSAGDEPAGDEFSGDEFPVPWFSDEGPAGIGAAGPWCPEPGITATGVIDGVDAPGPGAGAPVGGATHLVQIVEMKVLVIVETVCVTCTISAVPEVMVLVTGQVVNVVNSLKMTLATVFFPHEG